jgi:hypothetical protein
MSLPPKPLSDIDGKTSIFTPSYTSVRPSHEHVEKEKERERGNIFDFSRQNIHRPNLNLAIQNTIHNGHILIYPPNYTTLFTIVPVFFVDCTEKKRVKE